MSGHRTPFVCESIKGKRSSRGALVSLLTHSISHHATIQQLNDTRTNITATLSIYAERISYCLQYTRKDTTNNTTTLTPHRLSLCLSRYESCSAAPSRSRTLCSLPSLRDQMSRVYVVHTTNSKQRRHAVRFA